jgi:hypothetical protein
MSARLAIAFRRITALAVLLLLGVCLWNFIAAPLVHSFRERQDTIAQLLDGLARLQQLAHHETVLRARLAALQADGAANATQLSGPSAAVVAADLQGRLQQLMVESGGSVRSALTAEPSREKGLTRIGVLIEGEVPENALTSLLYAVLSEQGPLFIDDLEITGRESASDGGSDPAPLSIRMLVFGFVAQQTS